MRALSEHEIDMVSGANASGTLAIGLAGGWASAVAGFGAGSAIGGPIGGAVGAGVGFLLGGAITVGYALASDDEAGSQVAGAIEVAKGDEAMETERARLAAFRARPAAGAALLLLGVGIPGLTAVVLTVFGAGWLFAGLGGRIAFAGIVALSVWVSVTLVNRLRAAMIAARGGTGGVRD